MSTALACADVRDLIALGQVKGRATKWYRSLAANTDQSGCLYARPWLPTLHAPRILSSPRLSKEETHRDNIFPRPCWRLHFFRTHAPLFHRPVGSAPSGYGNPTRKLDEVYRITALMPAMDASFQYRPRQDGEAFERVATEESLDLVRIEEPGEACPRRSPGADPSIGL